MAFTSSKKLAFSILSLSCFSCDLLFVDIVYPRELGSVYQVFHWIGKAISLPDCSPPGWLHPLHANVAACATQVWQENYLLRGHVDPLASATLHALPRPFPIPLISFEFPRCYGSLLRVLDTMVRRLDYEDCRCHDFPSVPGQCCQM